MDTSHLLKHAEYLVSQDETLLALRCLECIPAWDRDHIPEEIQSLRNEILSRILTVHDLMDDWRELPKDLAHSQLMMGSMRGQVLEHAFKNYQGVPPHLVDYGPGDFVFAIALSAAGFDFSYQPITVQKEAEAEARKRLAKHMRPKAPDAPVWFVAYEIIEHLQCVDEIKAAYARVGGAHKVFISTPRYTFHEGTPGWRKEGIHHLRAYTPREFVSEVMRLFPEHKFHFLENKESRASDMVMVSL